VKYFCFAILIFAGGVLILPAQTHANAAAEISAPATAGTNAAARPAPRGPMLIESDGPAFFDLATREATYFGNVRVDDPDMKLRCGWLTADLPQAGRHVDHIVARTNVVIDFAYEKGQPCHATGNQAVYFYQAQGGVTNDTVTLTGNPAQIEDALGTQTGEEIIFDRANNRVSIPRNGKMVSRQNLNGAMSGTNSPPETNPPAAAPR
jgi:lipopolysaccharide export system protein LptA